MIKNGKSFVINLSNNILLKTSLDVLRKVDVFFFLFFFFYGVTLLYFREATLYRFSLIMIWLAIFGISLFKFSIYEKNRETLFFYIAAILLIVFSFAFSSTLAIQANRYFFISLMVGVFILTYHDNFKNLVENYFLITSITVFSSLIYLLSFEAGNSVISNRNYITGVTVNLLFICLFLNNKYQAIDPKVMVWLSSLACFVSFLAMGRAGMISHIILLISSILLLNGTKTSNLKFLESIKKEYKKPIIIFIIVMIAFLFYSFQMEKLTYFIEKGLSDTGRWGIIKSFFSNFEFKNFIFGDYNGMLKDISTNNHYGNYHNTFIALVSDFGILGVFFILFLLISLLRQIRHSWVITFAATAPLFKSSVDTAYHIFTILSLGIIISESIKQIYSKYNVKLIKI